MQLTCKFVPGNTLSRDVLDYILSPDECIGQLSRTRNLQDVVRQLPKPLSESLPQSAKKTSTDYLQPLNSVLFVLIGLPCRRFLARVHFQLPSFRPTLR